MRPRAMVGDHQVVCVCWGLLRELGAFSTRKFHFLQMEKSKNLHIRWLKQSNL